MQQLRVALAGAHPDRARALTMEALRRPRLQYRTSAAHRRRSMLRRDTLSQDENGVRIRCINENKQGTHGPPTKGCRCDACDATYQRTAR